MSVNPNMVTAKPRMRRSLWHKNKGTNINTGIYKTNRLLRERKAYSGRKFAPTQSFNTQFWVKINELVIREMHLRPSIWDIIHSEAVSPIGTIIIVPLPLYISLYLCSLWFSQNHISKFLSQTLQRIKFWYRNTIKIKKSPE